MRPGLPIAVTLAVGFGAPGPASALQSSDTMQAWKSASDKERADLLMKLFGGKLDRAEISRCMTGASTTPGHGDLPVRKVARACAAAGPADQPV